MSEIVVDRPQNGIILEHPFKDKLPDVEEFCKAENEAGVVNTINSFCNKVKNLSEKYSLQIDSNVFKGDALELLVEYILKTNASDNRIGIYDYSPIDSAEDYGVDGYGIGENGNPATVQVKFRAGDCILTANEDHLTNFLSNSQNAHGVKMDDRKNMLIITTGLKVDERTIENMLFNKVRVLNREALREMFDNRPEWWIRFYESIKLSRTQKSIIPIVDLRPHQKEAVTAGEPSDKGKIILPTGTGKTLIECELARLEIIKQKSLGNFSPVIKVNSSRILLCFQLFEEYFKYLNSYGISCRYANFNSGKADDGRYALELRKMGGIYREIISTTSPKGISDFYNKCKIEKIPLLVFSTYHSSENFDRSGLTPDLTIHDEAHNLVSSEFNRAATLPSKRNLFFTATEKVTDAEVDLGMNNPEIFGDRIYAKSPKQMIDMGEMVPPYIHVIRARRGQKVNLNMIDKDYGALVRSVSDAFFAHQRKIKEVSSSPENIGAKVLVVCRGQEDLIEMFKSKVFEMFREANPTVHIFALSSEFGLYIDGEHYPPPVTNIKKHRLIKFLQGLSYSEQCILFHVDMVGEGIDVPGITGVMPFRNCEESKFLQNIGRASRLHLLDRYRIYAGEISITDRTKWVKPYSWVIVPTFLENSEGFYGRMRGYVQRLKTDFGYIPAQHTVIDNVRGLDEDEDIDAVNEKVKNRVSTNSGLKKFEHEFEDTRSITEKIIFDDEYQAECERVEKEFESLIL